MAKTDYQSIDEYQQTFPKEVQERLQTIREMVHKIAPGVTEVISYQIPAFQLGEKKKLIYYCAFPKHITLSNPWSASFLKEFEKELKGYKVSKSAIQFPLDKPLPLSFIKRIIQYRKKELM